MSKDQFTLEDLAAHVAEVGMGVVATVSAAGNPEAAFMELAATEDGEILFVTRSDARKSENLRVNPRVAVVVGWESGVTVQVEGVADRPTGEERVDLARVFEESFPDTKAQAEGFAVFRIRPRWARYYDTNSDSFAEIETTWTEPEGS